MFFPELTLGAKARELSDNRSLELQHFLVAVVRQRHCPLHLANLWNALYFNYDLAYRGFRADHLEQRRIPTRTEKEQDWSLPVGGFVRVHTETACGDLLGEVIYKEGAHPSLQADGWLDPALSGAPATVRETLVDQAVSIVRERFVLDLAAFGAGGSDMTPRQYDRLCRKELWLDSRGHLLMEAMYASDEAELEDLDFYADYLLKEHREGLLAFCFEGDLPDDELREALLRSFEAVRELALGCSELGCWRGKYFFSLAEYRARLDDSERVLGAGDLRAIFRSLAHVPAGESRCYSPIGSRILEVLERDGLDDEEESLVRGCQYVTAVCHANAYVGETLAREQESGILPDGIHVRLDDDWQGGGVWRAERVEDPAHYSLKSVPALVPVRLGYAESRGAAEAAETFDPAEQPMASSQTGFRIPLTRRDRELGRLRLTLQAAEMLAVGVIDVRLRHDDVREQWAVERDGNTLYGVQYPLELHPGILLHCNVEGGGSVVRVRTVRVAPALTASDGRRFDYETNVAVYEREMRLTELKATDKRGDISLTELVNRAFRTRGRKREDSSRALTLSELALVILGPTWKPSEMPPLQEAVAAMGLDCVDNEFIWRPRFTRRTRSSDRSLLAAYGETKARGRLARTLRRHWVPMHLRHYTEFSGRAPSSAKRASYPEARRRWGMHGVFPEELPAGSTWVEPYSWGGEGDEPTMVQLEIRLDGQESVARTAEESEGSGPKPPLDD